MRKDTIKKKLFTAINILFQEDSVLIKNDVSERAICHRLAIHLQKLFRGYDVDCEYNRNCIDGIRKPKTIWIIERELNRRIRQNNITSTQLTQITVSAFPDIIIHKRESNKDNILIIEVKKEGADIINSEFDMTKLKAFTSPYQDYHYKLGAYIEFKTGEADLPDPYLEWFENGDLEPIE